MILIFFGLLIAIIALLMLSDGTSWRGEPELTWYGVLVAFLITGGTLYWSVQIGKNGHNQVLTRTNLVALQDSINSEGRFFLGSGYIEGNLNYFYYKKIGVDRYMAGKVSGDGTVIIETDKEKPRIDEYRCEAKNWKVIFFGLDMCIAKPTEIYIPKGSILQNYQLDLKS